MHKLLLVKEDCWFPDFWILMNIDIECWQTELRLAFYQSWMLFKMSFRGVLLEYKGGFVRAFCPHFHLGLISIGFIRIFRTKLFNRIFWSCSNHILHEGKVFIEKEILKSIQRKWKDRKEIKTEILRTKLIEGIGFQHNLMQRVIIFIYKENF